MERNANVASGTYGLTIEISKDEVSMFRPFLDRYLPWFLRPNDPDRRMISPSRSFAREIDGGDPGSISRREWYRWRFDAVASFRAPRRAKGMLLAMRPLEASLALLVVLIAFWRLLPRVISWVIQKVLGKKLGLVQVSIGSIGGWKLHNVQLLLIKDREIRIELSSIGLSGSIRALLPFQSSTDKIRIESNGLLITIRNGKSDLTETKEKKSLKLRKKPRRGVLVALRILSPLVSSTEWTLVDTKIVLIDHKESQVECRMGPTFISGNRQRYAQTMIKMSMDTCIVCLLAGHLEAHAELNSLGFAASLPDRKKPWVDMDLQTTKVSVAFSQITEKSSKPLKVSICNVSALLQRILAPVNETMIGSMSHCDTSCDNQRAQFRAGSLVISNGEALDLLCVSDAAFTIPFEPRACIAAIGDITGRISQTAMQELFSFYCKISLFLSKEKQESEQKETLSGKRKTVIDLSIRKCKFVYGMVFPVGLSVENAVESSINQHILQKDDGNMASFASLSWSELRLLMNTGEQNNLDCKLQGFGMITNHVIMQETQQKANTASNAFFALAEKNSTRLDTCAGAKGLSLQTNRGRNGKLNKLVALGGEHISFLLGPDDVLMVELMVKEVKEFLKHLKPRSRQNRPKVETSLIYDFSNVVLEVDVGGGVLPSFSFSNVRNMDHPGKGLQFLDVEVLIDGEKVISSECIELVFQPNASCESYKQNFPADSVVNVCHSSSRDQNLVKGDVQNVLDTSPNKPMSSPPSQCLAESCINVDREVHEGEVKDKQHMPGAPDCANSLLLHAAKKSDEEPVSNESRNSSVITLGNTEILLPSRMMLRDKIEAIEMQLKAYFAVRKSVIRALKGAGDVPREDPTEKPGFDLSLSFKAGVVFEVQRDPFESFIAARSRNLQDAMSISTGQKAFGGSDVEKNVWELYYLQMKEWRQSSSACGLGHGALLRVVAHGGHVALAFGKIGPCSTARYCKAIRALDSASGGIIFEGEHSMHVDLAVSPSSSTMPKMFSINARLEDVSVGLAGMPCPRLRCSTILCNGTFYLARQMLMIPPASYPLILSVGNMGRGLVKDMPKKGARPPVKCYTDLQVRFSGLSGLFVQTDLLSYVELASEAKRLSKSPPPSNVSGHANPSLPWWDLIRYLWHGRISVSGDDFSLALSPHNTHHGIMKVQSETFSACSSAHGKWTWTLQKAKVFRDKQDLDDFDFEPSDRSQAQPLLEAPVLAVDLHCVLDRADRKAPDLHHLHLSSRPGDDGSDFPMVQSIGPIPQQHLPVSLFETFRSVSASAQLLLRIETSEDEYPQCFLRVTDWKWMIDLVKLFARPPRIIRDASKRRKFRSHRRLKRHPDLVGSPFLLVQKLEVDVCSRGFRFTFNDDDALAASISQSPGTENKSSSPADGLQLSTGTISCTTTFCRRMNSFQRLALCHEKTSVSSGEVMMTLPPSMTGFAEPRDTDVGSQSRVEEDPELFAEVFDRLRKGHAASSPVPTPTKASNRAVRKFVLSLGLMTCNTQNDSQAEAAGVPTDIVVDGMRVLWTRETLDAIWCCFDTIKSVFLPSVLQDRKITKPLPPAALLNQSSGPSGMKDVTQHHESLLSLLVSGREVATRPTETEAIRLLVTVNHPQITFDSEEGHERILLSAAGGLLARKRISNSNREGVRSEQHKLSFSLEYVQMHVIPLDIDPDAGLLWLVPEQATDTVGDRGVPPLRSMSLTPPKRRRAMFVPIFSPCHMQLCHEKDVCATSGRRISHQLTLSSPEIQVRTSSREFQALISVISKLIISSPSKVMLEARLLREAVNTLALAQRYGGYEKIAEVAEYEYQTSDPEILDSMHALQETFAAFKAALHTQTHLIQEQRKGKDAEQALGRIRSERFCEHQHTDLCTKLEAHRLKVQTMLDSASQKAVKVAQALCDSYHRYCRLVMRGQLAPDLSLSFDFSQVDWILTGPHGNEVSATITSLSFVRLREEDGSAVSRFKSGSLLVKKISTGNPILAPLLKGASSRREAAVRVFAEVAPTTALDHLPLKSMKVKTVYDHLEVNVMPHEICLDEDTADFLQSFFLPDAPNGAASVGMQAETERKSLLLPSSNHRGRLGKKHKASLSMNDADLQSALRKERLSPEPKVGSSPSSARRGSTTGSTQVIESLSSVPKSATNGKGDLPTLFRYVKVDALSVQVSYTGAPISIHQLKLVADARLYHDFLGTGQELLQRVKWDWTKSVLRSVAGLQHRKFRQLVPDKEATSPTRTAPRRKRDTVVRSFLDTDVVDEGTSGDAVRSPDEKKAWLLFGHQYKGKR